MNTTLKTLCLTTALTLSVGAASQAQAGHFHGGIYHTGSSYGGYGGYGGYSQPILHRTSVHIDRQYHPTSTHWTPSQGLHTHGHIDAVQHVVPAHVDTLHNGHIHGNPWFHN